MSREEFVSLVAERAGIRDLEQAGLLVDTVLAFFGERLSGRLFRLIAEDLPAGLVARPLARRHEEGLERTDLYAWVRDQTNVPMGQSVESSAVVCQLLAEVLSPGTLYLLHETLPASLNALFTPRSWSEHFEFIHLDPAQGTLAEGRPGSRHPVSEGHPPGAHLHSVVNADNPHGDTKLSSATGLTQEREEETLAAGHPAGAPG